MREYFSAGTLGHNIKDAVADKIRGAAAAFLCARRTAYIHSQIQQPILKHTRSVGVSQCRAEDYFCHWDFVS